MAGQLMVNLSQLRENLLFTLAGMLICASIVPLALTPTVTPKPIPSARLDLRFLIALSPAGAVGCFLVGVAEGAFRSLGPVFAQERNLDVADVTHLMATIGPLIASLSMEGDRAGGLFVFVSVAVGTLGLFVVYRMLTAPSGDPGERLDFRTGPQDLAVGLHAGSRRLMVLSSTALGRISKTAFFGGARYRQLTAGLPKCLHILVKSLREVLT